MSKRKTIKINLIALLTLLSMNAQAEECVVLLHGLARTSDSMATIQQTLVSKNYRTVNIDYPSRDYAIETLASLAIPAGIESCERQGASNIHFITHSLGGILVRYYQQHHGIAKLGRVVMLSPPNQGSEVVDNLKFLPGFDFLNGPAGRQLGTDELSIPRQLHGVNFDVGIIAGSYTMNPLLSYYLPGVNDGKVTVKSTIVEGMKAHLIMPVTHTFMMQDKQVIEQAIYFIENSEFIYMQ